MARPGPNFIEKRISLDKIPTPTGDQYKRAALTIARASSSVDDCIILLDIVGINIKQVWS